MAVFENVTLQSCRVKVVSGVAAAIVDRFCVRQTSTPGAEEMITYVAPAAGGVPDGIIAMKPDATAFPDTTGFVVTSYVRPDNCEAIIELGEIVTQGALLRCGGNSTEVDGAAYLADASGDVIIGKAAEGGAVGQKIRFNFGYRGVVA